MKQFHLLVLLFWGMANGLTGQTLSTSTLPIVKIETQGQEVPDEPKITARLSIINKGAGQLNSIGDPANVYEGVIGIERRGASSGYYPQASYAIETRLDNGEERPVSLFDWPEESDFCLISNYNDRSMLRNILAYRTFQQMGHYAPRHQLVEVTLNGQYRGIYLLCERIKRDKGRVDIAKLGPEELEGDALTGGYIIKVDYFDASNSWQGAFPAAGRPIHYVYYYPKPEDIQIQQKNYIQNYVYNFEKALYGNKFTDSLTGYRAYIDLTSFIDYLIVQELTRNIDGFKKSSYFWKAKDSDGGRLHAGPVWDFDWALKNIDECDIFRATDGSGYAYLINNCNGDLPAPGWFTRMLSDTFFENQLRCRYDSLRKTTLSTANIHHFMDSMALSLQIAQTRHFARWAILGQNTGTPEVPPIPATYNAEINKLKTWLQLRLSWLDKNMPGRCGPTPSPEPPKPPLRLAPNPVLGGETLVEGRTFNQTDYRLYDVAGRLVRGLTRFADDHGAIDVSSLPAGVYLVELAWVDGMPLGKRLKLVVY